MRKFIQGALVWVLFTACAPAASVPPTPPPTVDTPAATPTAPAEVRPELSPSGALLPGQIEFTMMDVGQGDGLLLRTATGVTVVVDTGTGSGGKAIARYLQREQVSSIDLLILTHPHADHIGGVSHILKSATVAAAWVSGYAGKTQTQERVLKDLETRGIPITPVRKGNQAILDGGVEISVLAPEDPLLDNSRSDANANSVVLWIKHGNVDFLLTGDAETETERRVLEVLRGRPPPNFEVLKVAHHGSRYASSETFLSRVSPQVALISCGQNNRYKHPHPDTLQRLNQTGAQIFRTDLHGTIQLRSDGENILIITEKQVQRRKQPRRLAMQLGKKDELTLHLPWTPVGLHSVSRDLGVAEAVPTTRANTELCLPISWNGNGANSSHDNVSTPYLDGVPKAWTSARQ